MSGLRLGESVDLSWDDDAAFAVDLSGKFPRFRIYADAEKGNRDRLLPMASDFAEFLLATPEGQRHGRVFKLNATYAGLLVCRWVMSVWERKIVADIGHRAHVMVDKTEDKHASAHDFRRAFGTRWSNRMKPPRLQLLMRHTMIDTTLNYYVEEDSDDMAADLWKQFGPEVRTSVGTSPVSDGLILETTRN